MPKKKSTTASTDASKSTHTQEAKKPLLKVIISKKFNNVQPNDDDDEDEQVFVKPYKTASKDQRGVDRTRQANNREKSLPEASPPNKARRSTKLTLRPTPPGRQKEGNAVRRNGKGNDNTQHYEVIESEEQTPSPRHSKQRSKSQRGYLKPTPSKKGRGSRKVVEPVRVISSSSEDEQVKEEESIELEESVKAEFESEGMSEELEEKIHVPKRGRKKGQAVEYRRNNEYNNEKKPKRPSFRETSSEMGEGDDGSGDEDDNVSHISRASHLRRKTDKRAKDKWIHVEKSLPQFPKKEKEIGSLVVQVVNQIKNSHLEDLVIEILKQKFSGVPKGNVKTAIRNIEFNANMTFGRKKIKLENGEYPLAKVEEDRGSVSSVEERRSHVDEGERRGGRRKRNAQAAKGKKKERIKIEDDSESQDWDPEDDDKLSVVSGKSGRGARGRAASRKKRESAMSIENSVEVKEEPPVVKRGRGRPKKIVVPDEIEEPKVEKVEEKVEEKMEEEMAPKRKRGRPKKVIKEDDMENLIEIQASPEKVEKVPEEVKEEKRVTRRREKSENNNAKVETPVKEKRKKKEIPPEQKIEVLSSEKKPEVVEEKHEKIEKEKEKDKEKDKEEVPKRKKSDKQGKSLKEKEDNLIALLIQKHGLEDKAEDEKAKGKEATQENEKGEEKPGKKEKKKKDKEKEKEKEIIVIESAKKENDEKGEGKEEKKKDRKSNKEKAIMTDSVVQTLKFDDEKMNGKADESVEPKKEKKPKKVKKKPEEENKEPVQIDLTSEGILSAGKDTLNGERFSNELLDTLFPVKKKKKKDGEQKDEGNGEEKKQKKPKKTKEIVVLDESAKKENNGNKMEEEDVVVQVVIEEEKPQEMTEKRESSTNMKDEIFASEKRKQKLRQSLLQILKVPNHENGKKGGLVNEALSQLEQIKKSNHRKIGEIEDQIGLTTPEKKRGTLEDIIRVSSTGDHRISEPRSPGNSIVDVQSVSAPATAIKRDMMNIEDPDGMNEASIRISHLDAEAFLEPNGNEESIMKLLPGSIQG